jgi:hypothetical protein
VRGIWRDRDMARQLESATPPVSRSRRTEAAGSPALVRDADCCVCFCILHQHDVGRGSETGRPQFFEYRRARSVQRRARAPCRCLRSGQRWYLDFICATAPPWQPPSDLFFFFQQLFTRRYAGSASLPVGRRRLLCCVQRSNVEGIWAAIAFFGLTYIYAHYFVATTLTELLGLFWALLSVPFFIEAFRTGSVKPALVAFAMTIVALMTRMGSMFTIPVLLLWLFWQFGHGIAAKLRIGVVSIGILLGVLGLNSLLQKAYGTSQGSTGGNFAYVLCGLTISTGWQGCPAKLAAEGGPLLDDEATVATQLYSLAWKNFSAQPKIFFRRLADGAEAFASQFPDVIWRGYGVAIEEPDWLFRNALTAISLMGFL